MGLFGIEQQIKNASRIILEREYGGVANTHLLIHRHLLRNNIGFHKLAILYFPVSAYIHLMENHGTHTSTTQPPAFGSEFSAGDNLHRIPHLHLEEIEIPQAGHAALNCLQCCRRSARKSKQIRGIRIPSRYVPHTPLYHAIQRTLHPKRTIGCSMRIKETYIQSELSTVPHAYRETTPKVNKPTLPTRKPCPHSSPTDYALRCLQGNYIQTEQQTMTGGDEIMLANILLSIERGGACDSCLYAWSPCEFRDKAMTW